jgi:hypothetical protein
MARFRPFTDDARRVLFLIRQLYPRLTWQGVAEVFNIMHRDRPNELRTQNTLTEQWYHRNGSQQTAWNRAIADRARNAYWTPAIANAVSIFRAYTNSTPRITPPAEEIVRFTHDQRTVLYLVGEEAIPWKERARIFNAVCGDELKKSITHNSLGSQYRKRYEKNEPKKAVEEEHPPAKKRRTYLREKPELTVAESWAIILSDFKTQQEIERVERLKKKIEERRGLKTKPDQPTPKDLVKESEPDGQVPVYDPQQDVGRWEFVTDDDETVTRTNLGAQIPGMPGHPSAENVRRYVLQWEGAGLLPWRAVGVNIERVQEETEEDEDEVDEEAEEGDQERNDEEDDHQGDADEEDNEEALAIQRTTRYVARHANAVGHWRFITEEDERLAATHLGGRPGMPARPSAWDVRRYRLREIRAGRFPHHAINHIWVYNRPGHEGEPIEPMYETSREALLDYWYAVLKEIWEAEELNK